MTIERVPLRAARAALSGLLTRVENGERLIITRDGKDAVMLVPAPAKPDASTARPGILPSRERAVAAQRERDRILAGNNRGSRRGS